MSLLVRCPDFRGCNDPDFNVYTQTGCLGQPNVSCLSRCPYFRGVLNEGFHYIVSLHILRTIPYMTVMHNRPFKIEVLSDLFSKTAVLTQTYYTSVQCMEYWEIKKLVVFKRNCLQCLKWQACNVFSSRCLGWGFV